MPRGSTIGLTYPAWLKRWRKAGTPKWPEVVKIVAVHWTDAVSSHDDDAAPMDAILVGILKDAEPDALTLVMEGFEDRDCRTSFSVPGGMVNRVIDVATIRTFTE